MPFAVQRSQFSTKINAIAGNALAISLAIVMLAPIIFSAFQYYFEVAHPSWVFWGGLTVSCLIVCTLRYSTIRPNGIDFLMAIFLSIIFASILLNGNEKSGAAAVLIIFFVIVPYVAGRSLNNRELAIFFRVTGLVALTGLMVVFLGLIELNKSEFMTDRVKTLFSVIDMHGVVVLGGGVIPQISLATGWLGLISFYYLTDSPVARSKRKSIFLSLALLFVSIYLLFLVGLRGALIATIVTCIFLAAIGRRSFWQRALVMLFIVVVSVFSYSNLSTERAGHYSAIARTASSLISHYKSDDKWHSKLTDGEDLNDSCRVKSDGIGTRILLFEKTKILIQEFALFGVGVGRWGIVTKCSGHFGTPHNIILHAAAELGLFGALIGALLIVTALIKVIIIRHNASGQYLKLSALSAAFFVFLLIQSQFSGGYIMEFQLYAMLGVISGLVTSSSRDEEVRLMELKYIYHEFIEQT